jgi:hypothetical protein
MWNPIFSPGGDEVRFVPSLAIDWTAVSSVAQVLSGG